MSSVVADNTITPFSCDRSGADDSKLVHVVDRAEAHVNKSWSVRVLRRRRPGVGIGRRRAETMLLVTARLGEGYILV